MNNFGLTLTDHPNTITQDELRNLLTTHGVICFRGIELTDTDLYDTMSKLGSVQDFEQQQAPATAADKDNNTIINLHNDDFLGRSRMGWHMDQTYLTTPYLPIRCLYAPVDPTPGNITSFMDVKTFTSVIEEEYPELLNEQGEYYIDSKKENCVIRPIFSYCEHVNLKLFRLDSRMKFINRTIDFEKFKVNAKEYLQKHENKIAVNKLRRNIPVTKVDIEELESKTFDLVCLSNTDHDLTTKYTIEVLPKVLRNECCIISDFILIDNDEFRFNLIEEMSSVKRFKNGNDNKQSLFLFQVQKNKVKSKDFKSEVKDSVNESKTFSKKEK
jgi:hypothetical protein